MRISDWSSDVCSSDLAAHAGEIAQLGLAQLDAMRRLDILANQPLQIAREPRPGSIGAVALDRKSVVSGKSVSVRVDLGGRRILKKKNKAHTNSACRQHTPDIYRQHV